MELENELKNFKNKKILIIGDIMLDEYIYGTTDRISPEAPVPVVKFEKKEYYPGGAANVAYNIASLGGIPYLVSFKGPSNTDTNGEILKNLLSKKNILNTFIYEIKNWETIVKTRIISHNQQIVRIDNEKDNQSTIEDDNELFNLINNITTNVKIDTCIISDYNKNTLSNKNIIKIIKLLTKLNIPIIVDSKRTNWEVFKNVTIITPNEKEFKLVNIKNKSIFELIKQYNIKFLLLTQGSKGMTLFTSQNIYQSFDSSSQYIYDVTGAGDTVVSVLALAKAIDLSILDCVYLSNKAAGIVVGKLGTATLTLNELIYKIKGHEI